MKNASIISKASIFVSLLLSTPLSAAIIEVSFTAEIEFVSIFIDPTSTTNNDNIFDSVQNNVSVGDQLTGTLVYNTTPDSTSSFSPTSQILRYAGPGAYLTFNIPTAGLSWSTVNTNLDPFTIRANSNSILTSNSNIGAKGYGSKDTFPDPLFISTTPGINAPENSLSIQFRTAGNFSANEVFQTPVNAGNFLDGSGNITLRENQFSNLQGDELFIRFNITSMNTVSAVPLPAAVWLFGSGFIGLAGLAIRRKRQP
jgi:hypothetical protein